MCFSLSIYKVSKDEMIASLMESMCPYVFDNTFLVPFSPFSIIKIFSKERPKPFYYYTNLGSLGDKCGDNVGMGES